MKQTATIAWTAVCLLAVLGSGLLPALAAAPAAPQEERVFQEDFATQTYMDYTLDAAWDILASSLALARRDGTIQSAPSVATDNGGNAFVAWTDYSHGDADIYAQRFDPNGNRLWAADLRVDSDPGTADQWAPGIAVDGSGVAFVMWTDARNGNADIYAQKLDADGNRLWAADLRVDSDPGTADQVGRAVAVDGSGHAVVVWHDDRSGNWDIYAQRLAADGNRLWAADVRINSDASTTQTHPAVAVDGSGNAVVAWEDWREGVSDIYAQRLDAAGNRLWIDDLRINSEDTLQQASAAVAVDGSGNAFVTWFDRRNDDAGDIYAQRLDAAGNRLWTSDLRVNSDTGTGGQGSPTVALDSSGIAVVAWSDARNGVSDIYAQRLDSTGNALWVADRWVNSEADTASQGSPAVAVDGSGTAFVVWSDGLDSDIRAQRLDTAGDRLWAVALRIDTDSGTVHQSSPAVAVDGSGNAIVAWSDERNGNADIYAQRLDAAGNRLWTADLRVNSDPGTAYQSLPAVGVDGTGHAVVVWYDNRSGNWDIYAQQLDAAGNRLWATDLRVNSDDGMTTQRRPNVAADVSGHALVVWEDLRNGNYDAYAQWLDPAGNKLLAADLRVNSDEGTAAQFRPSAAVDGSGNAYAVWYDSRNGTYSNWDIYAQRLDLDGNRLWPDDLRVNSDVSTVYQLYPDVAVDGSDNAIVVWEDGRNGNPYDIYAQRLDVNGNRQWPADVHVNSAGAGLYPRPGVDVDSSGSAAVVWDDDRNDNSDGNVDVYAQRLDADGNRLWAADLRVNSDTGREIQSQASSGVAVDGSGIAFVVWYDLRNGNNDVYAQRINTVGGKAWLADLQLVYPDLFYFPTGTAQSRTVDSVDDNIRQATLTADYQANAGSVQFSLSNDGGAHWANVTPGITQLFTATGSDLRWKAVLTVDPLWNRTPIVDSLRIDYSTDLPAGDDYEPDDTCAQAKPIQVNGGAQAHTFHQPADADWVWFSATADITYTIQTANTGPNADTIIDLHNACEQPPFTSQDFAFGPGASITFQAEESGIYYVNVHQHDPTVYGDGTGYEVSVRAESAGGVAIIVAGRWSADDYRQPIISITANLAYQTFLNSGFLPEDIQYLNSDLSQSGVDGDSSWVNVRTAIQDWARVRVGAGIPLWVYLADHGNVDLFHNEVDEVVTAADLNLWLSNLEAATGVDQVNVIIDACNSGSFIDTQVWNGAGLQEISGHGRVVVSSTTYLSAAYAPRTAEGQLVLPMYFSAGLWYALGQSQDLWTAFLAGRARVEAAGQLCGDYDYTCQRPWLDDTADAWFDGDDGLVAQGRGLNFGGEVAPYIDWVELGSMTGGQATVQARVRDDSRVARVWVEVFAPSFEPPQSIDGTTPIIDVPEAELVSVGESVYQVEYDGFAESGTYQVVVHALDDRGNSAVPKWLWMEFYEVFLPLVLRHN